MLGFELNFWEYLTFLVIFALVGVGPQVSLQLQVALSSAEDRWFVATS